PEAQRLAGLVEREQRRLQVVARDRRGAGGDGARTLGQGPLDARVEQLVQEQRVRGHAFGQEGAARDQVDQARERGRLLVEQREVARAAEDVVQQRQQAADRLQR